MTCIDCIHENLCVTKAFPSAFENTHWEKEPCDHFKDKSLFIEMPCKFGQHLWRVTYPYRQEPKVTEFVVKNFRTIGKQHKMQIEVQAVNSPITNWMRIEDFFKTKEEAENALKERLANEKL